ncbi:MAG TPA: acyl-CoA dehydrogenase family protein [Baekduia sp.]
MTFAFTADQLALAEVVDGVLARHAGAAALRAAAGGDGEVRDVIWRQLAEIDVCSLTVPERAGGLGLGPIELVAVLEAAGRHAAPVPLAATIGGFVPLVVAAGEGGGAGDVVLARVVAGARATFALDPDRAAGLPRWRDGRLTGTVDGILDADRVELVAVPVRGSDDRPLLIVAAPDALGIVTTPAMDEVSAIGRIAADGLVVDGAIELPGDPSPAIDVLLLAAGAELVGLSATLVSLSVEHARNRVQFGKPIGAFEAVKHRIVDAHLGVERARSLVRQAAVLAAAADAEAGVVAHLAKAAASEAAGEAARMAVQVHGGIGITHEHDVSLLYLRARTLAALLGGADDHYAAAATAHLAG